MISEATRLTKLDNGLRVITHRVAGARTSDIYVQSTAGSRDEVDGGDPRGILHGLEHAMAFGSEKYPSLTRELIEGVPHFDPEHHLFNPAARLDDVICSTKIPQASTLFSLDVIGDMFSHPLLLQRNVEHERIPLQIERGKNKLMVGAMENWMAGYVGYGRHPRLHPVVGSKSGIDAITSANLRDFHGRHIHGGRTIVSVVGNVDHEQIVHGVESSFSLPSGMRSPSESPVHTGGDMRYAMPHQEVAHIAVSLKAPSQSDVRASAAYEVAGNLLRASNNRGRHSIFDALRGKYGLIYGVGTGFDQSLDAGLVTIAYETLPELASATMRTIYDVIADMADRVDEDSFARVQTRERNFFQNLKKGGRHAWRLAEDLQLYGEIVPAEFYSGLRLQVSKNDVREAARDMLSHPVTFLAAGDTDNDAFPCPQEVRDIFRANQPVFEKLVA